MLEKVNHQQDMKRVSAVVSRMILGASESVDMIVTPAAGFVELYVVQDMATLVDRRLRLRAILAKPSSWVSDIAKSDVHLRNKTYENLIAQLRNQGWDIRIGDWEATGNCIIVDNQTVIISYLEANRKRGGQYYYRINRPEIVSVIKGHFDIVWEEGKDGELLYEDLLLSSISHIGDAIVTASKERWADMIAYFSSHPEKMYELDPRKFEELVAELLIRENMDIELTKVSKDGGRDILAVATTNLGKHLYLVECKRYSATKKVGVSIVRALYGIVEMERATSGIIVTTSDFTKGAFEFGKTIQNRLELKNYASLKKWLRQYGTTIKQAQ